jgi:uncharacterized phage-associated protein
MIDPEARYIVFLADPTAPGGHSACTVRGEQVITATATMNRFHTFEDLDTDTEVIVNLANVVRIIRKP